MQYEDGSISPLRAFFRNKWVRIVLILDVFIVISVIVLVILNSNKTVTITFNVAPVDAKIFVNGAEYTNGKFAIMPGKYEIEISHNGLSTKKFNIELKAQDYITFSTFLSNSEDFEFYMLKDNYESFKKLSEIASAENNRTFDNDKSAEEFIKSFSKKISIGNILPINYQETNEEDISMSPYFSIDINKDCKYYNLCLLVSPVLNTTHEEVLDFIRNRGYNPDVYEIIFEDTIEL